LCAEEARGVPDDALGVYHLAAVANLSLPGRRALFHFLKSRQVDFPHLQPLCAACVCVEVDRNLLDHAPAQGALLQEMFHQKDSPVSARQLHSRCQMKMLVARCVCFTN